MEVRRGRRWWLGVLGGGMLVLSAALLLHPLVGTRSIAPASPAESRPPSSAAGPGFTPVNVEIAVTKVKDLLVGLPATEEEIRAVKADRSALKALVGKWMSSPVYRRKMMSFFVTAFEQDQWDMASLDLQFCKRIQFYPRSAEILENFQQSFARTVLALIDEGQPFPSAITTTRFMMTPALMAAYATIDAMHIGDHVICNPDPTPAPVTIESSTAVPLEQAVDAKSPLFMTFYDSAVAGCPGGKVVFPPGSDGTLLAELLFNYVVRPTGQPRCGADFVPPEDRYVKDSDFTDWRMVTIREPKPGEHTTALYDLPAMRTGHELVLGIPRIGFFSTPAFAARWPTNKSNQHRVTMNQATIVALGLPFDLTNKTQPHSLSALDEHHAPSGTECYGCHQSLDPMRQFFVQAYSQSFSRQEALDSVRLPGEFAFHGVSATGTGIASLAALLAGHPLLATAWVQKLCTYATSKTCDESDPEFLRLVGVFSKSNFSWNALVQELFASPLVTYQEETKTADATGETVSMARQTHLCTTLSERLGVDDICALAVARGDDLPGAPKTPEGRLDRAWQDLCTALEVRLGSDLCMRRRESLFEETRRLMTSWPADQYARGHAEPSLVTSPSLLVRGGLESLCASAARRVVDSDATPFFRSSDPDGAVDNLVTRLMGLTADRARIPRSILQQHFEAARQQGASAHVALQSTFVLACLTPYVSGVGS